MILKILLVQSPVGRKEAPIYPIGLAYLAGALKDHECFGIDLSLEDEPNSALLLKLEEVKPQVVAVSVRNIDDSSYPITHWYLDSFAEVMEALGNWQGTVIAGGAGFSIYPSEIMQLWPRINIALVGEGEIALPVLLDYLEGGNKPDWLVDRIASPPRPSLKTINLPDYSVFLAHNYPGRGSVGVQTRRGCVFNCAYCTYKSISGSGFRLRPINHVIDDIRAISKEGFDSFIFVDSVFDHPLDYCRELIAAISEQVESVPAWGAWLSETLPFEVLDEMYEAGCRWVDFSPDVITKKGWKLMHKGGTLKNLWPTVKYARSIGLTVGINFFSASPGENFWALIQKFIFMIKARVLLGFGSTFVNIGTIRLYKGATLSDSLYPGSDMFKPVFFEPRGFARILLRVFQSLKKL